MIKLIILHFIADFLLQSRELGKKKSSDWGYLCLHCLIQLLVFAPFIGFEWAMINAFVHGVIDKNIWNIYKAWAYYRIKKQYEADESGTLFHEYVNAFQYWEDHWFYTTIGFDQMLHMLTLALIAQWMVT